MERPIVKYLDPVSGEYEFATVVDIGDLRNLNTTIKSDIVGAINSIVSGGVNNPISDERIEDLERIIDSLKDGTFNIEDFGSIDEYLKQQFLDELDRLNAQNKAEMEGVLTKLDTSVDDAIGDYQERVAAQNIILENAENTLADARGTLEAKAAELETANIGFSELEHDFNELEGYISTNIRTIDFDNFNAMVEDYESVVTQTSSEVGVDMSGSTLSYLTGRVTDAEANISIQADEITSKMGYDEFQYMPVPKYSYGENLLFDTFDFGDAWNGKNGAQVTPDTFLFGKVVAFNSPTGLYETRTDDLTIGESYVFSTYVNVQPSSKEPSEDRYEPVSSSYDPTDFRVQIGGESFNPGVYEDLSGINGWVRINQEFVADAVNPIISITPTGVNSQSEVAYMAMPKVEKELTVTPWQPHVEDDYATISSAQSMIKQQANSITAFVTGVSELDESYKQATSTFQMLADGFKANTDAIEVYEDTVERYGTEYSNINGKFEQKVWKDDFEGIIEDINIDNRNRVLNSDFIRSEISSSDRRLIVEDWSLNSDWEIKTIDDNKYLSRDRTGLVQNLITSASSNYFPVRDGERVLFGFDLIHSGLDNDKVFAIELFDISDKRLLKEEFSLSSLTKVDNRYHGSFNISTPGTQKGNVVLQLPKNGNVSFTKISFQNADIGSVDWSPAPEDSWIIQSKLETYISQVEDEITIGGVGRKIDTLTGLLTEDKGTFTLNPDKIATEVFNSETYDDMGFVNRTNFEQTADGWMQEITSKGMLAGYINASPDTYRISFDKIMLEGTTWADALGSSKIMVTENFALIGQNGRPVLDVNNDGSINMNVTSLKIGQYNALTTDDKSDIESEVVDKVIETTEPYIHIAYADTIEGEGLSFNPSGKGFIGFAKSHLPTPFETASSYTWSKYVGKDGLEGNDGVGIDGTIIEYATSIDGNNYPGTGWDSNIPDIPENHFLWTKTIWQYTNNTIKVAYSVSKVGKDGIDGMDGVDGVDGVSIIGVTEYYLASNLSKGVTSSSNFPWTTNMPELSELKPYLWNYETTQLSNGTSTAPTIPVIIGKHSEDGVSITGVSNQYALGASNTVAPTTGWSDIPKPTTPEMRYLWNYEIISYSKGNPTETPKVVIGTHGASGSDGNPGKDGVGLKETIIEYVGSDSGTVRPISGWDTTIPYVAPGNYIWTRTRWIYTDNTSEYGYTVSRIGKDGNRGDDGNPGKDGVGVDETVIEYSTSLNGAVYPSSGWQATLPTIPDNHFLWTRTTWHYTDDTNEVAYSVSKVGKDGSDGRGISRTEIRYANHTNGTTAPTSGWSQNIPDPVKGEYQWTRTYVEYTKGDPTTSYSVSYIPLDGQRGHSGNGVVGSNITYAQTDTNTKPGASSWVATMPTPAPGKYLWTRTVISYTDGSTSEAVSVAYQAIDGYTPVKGKDYFDGKDGVSITSVVEKYKLSTLAEGETTSGTWNSAPRTPTRQLPYLWNYEIINYSEGNPTVTEPAVIGMYSADGTSIVSVEELYALSNTTTQPSDSSFTPGIKVTSENNKYLWNKEIITLQHDDGRTEPKYHYAIIGTHGEKGDDGRGVKETVVEYITSSSGTVTPTGVWSKSIPSVNPGQYLWTRTKWVYTDNRTEYAYSVSYEGKNGLKGDDGIGVVSTIVEYSVSSSGTTTPTGGWSSTVPTVNKGQYLWTKTVWEYSNNDIETAYSVSRIGQDGVGIQKTEIHYAKSTSGTTRPSTGWNLAVPSTSPGDYIWTRTTWTYTDNDTEEGYSVSRIGKDGNTGNDGAPGKDGVGIKSTVINYATSSSGTVKPTSGWTSTVPTVPSGNYLWTRTTWTYTDNDVEEGYSVSRIGKDGVKGDAGKGIKSAVIAYAIHTNGTTAPTSGWVSTVPNPVKGRYMWTRTVTTYTEGNPITTYSVAYQATDGQEGPKGADGSNGTGISSSAVTYAQTTSGTTTPTSWNATRPAPKKGEYLWSRTIITYTNGTSSTAYSTSYSATDGQKGDRGDQGPQGPPGIPGDKGDDGKSQWVHIRYSANSNGSGMTTNPSSTTKYVGIAVTNSATAPTSPGYKWSKYIGENGSNGAQGPQGLPGKNGTNGTTTYTWVRYADTPTSGMNQYPAGKKYIGLAFNKTTQTEGSNYSDYKWSLMPQNIEIGGRNLLRNSGETISNGSYNIARYDFTDAIKQGEEVTLTIWGSLAATKSSFRAYNSGGNVHVTILTNNGDGTYSSTFKWTIGSSTNTYLNVYAFTNAQTGTSTINKIKLERGNTATDWTPAPEDIQADIDSKSNQTDIEAALNAIASDLLVKQQEIEAAASAGELSAFIERYNNEQKTRATEKRDSEKDLSDAQKAISLINNELDDMAETWNFYEKYIKFANGTIIIGDDTKGNHIQLSDDRIAFFSNNLEVASISQGLMTIEAGAFVKEIQVAKYIFQETTTDHLTIRYVG